MAKKKHKPPKPWQEVLVYRNFKRRSQVGNLRRALLEYRAANNIPYRCDVQGCQYHDPTSAHFTNGRPMWQGAELPLTIDHINGNWRDNRPGNLRFLCPNCMFQQPTHAGRNKGHVISSDDWGFVLKGAKNTLHFTYFASGGVKVGGSALVSVTKANPT